jgi:hypothetical protein
MNADEGGLTPALAVEIVAALPQAMRGDVARVFERTMFTAYQIAVADAVELFAAHLQTCGDEVEAMTQAAAKTGASEAGIYRALEKRWSEINHVRSFRKCCKKVPHESMGVTSSEF